MGAVIGNARAVLRSRSRGESALVAMALAMSSMAFAEARPLSVEDYLNWEFPDGPRLSPDGHHVLFTRIIVDKLSDGYRSEIWVVDTEDGELQKIDDGCCAVWSPAGDQIAYIGFVENGQQLFTQKFAASAERRRLIKGAEIAPTTFGGLFVDASNSLKWSPDGKQIAFLANVPAEPSFDIELPDRPENASWTPDPVIIERRQFQADRLGYKTSYRHIFVVPSEGGAPAQVTRGPWDVGVMYGAVPVGGAIEWTPDGESIIFTGRVSDQESVAPLSDINLVDLEGRRIRRLTKTDGQWGQPTLSPSGQHIVYAGHELAEESFVGSSIRIMRVDGSDDREILGDVPLEEGRNSLFWRSDGQAVFFALAHHGSINLHELELDGKVRQLTKGAQFILQANGGANGKGVAIKTAPSAPANIVEFNTVSGAIRELTNLNENVLRDVQLSSVEAFWTKSQDGTPIQGWIMKPPGFNPAKKYPVILEIHGGPHFMYGNHFDFRLQELAASGYVVAYANPRGSTGYGVDFANAIDNAFPGNLDFQDLMAGVDAVVAKGYVDEHRLYVTGCSAGGTQTAWAITQTDRFAAAAVLCPTANWISYAANVDGNHWGYSRFRPHFWEDPSLWLEHSPVMQAYKVKTPTLIMTGEHDLRTPLTQSIEFFVALKSCGVPAALIPVRNEGHPVWGLPSNMLRTQLYIRKWFELYPARPPRDTKNERGSVAGRCAYKKQAPAP